MNLDQYRSPSMWEKLEIWKAEKQKRKNSSKPKAQQPFKIGSSKEATRKIPPKASDKMRLLSESNQKTSWSHRTSPRHLNYRKSLSTVARSGQTAKKSVMGKENLRQTVQERNIRNSNNQSRTPAVRRSVRKSCTPGLEEFPSTRPVRKSGGKTADRKRLGNVKPKGTENMKPKEKYATNTSRQSRTLAARRSLQKTEAVQNCKSRLQESSSRPIREAGMETATAVHGKKLKGNLKEALGQQDCKKRKRLEEDEEEENLRSALKKISKTPQSNEVNNSLSLKATVPAGGGAEPYIGGQTRNQLSQRKDEVPRKRVSQDALQAPKGKTNTENASQINRRKELEQWLLAKGKTPRRASKILKTPRVTPRSTKGASSDPYSSQLTVEETMDTCRHLLEQGCPARYLSSWMEGLEEKLPCLAEMESFVQCQKLVQERLSTQHDERVATEEEAVSNTTTMVTPPVHRKPRRSSLQLLSPVEEEFFSAVKYQVKEATPYFKRIHDALGGPSQTPSTMIVTPVRRSIRLSKRKSVTFSSRQPEICVDSLAQLPSEEPVQLILKPNRALQEEFDVAEELD